MIGEAGGMTFHGVCLPGNNHRVIFGGHRDAVVVWHELLLGMMVGDGCLPGTVIGGGMVDGTMVAGDGIGVQTNFSRWHKQK